MAQGPQKTMTTMMCAGSTERGTSKPGKQKNGIRRPWVSGRLDPFCGEYCGSCWQEFPALQTTPRHPEVRVWSLLGHGVYHCANNDMMPMSKEESKLHASPTAQALCTEHPRSSTILPRILQLYHSDHEVLRTVGIGTSKNYSNLSSCECH